MTPRRWAVVGLFGLMLAGLPAIADAADATAVTITVAKSGGEFSTIQAAVNAVPDDLPTPYVISIEPGVYAERVTIPVAKRHLTLQGASHNPHDVVITAADYQGETNPATGTSYGTEGSATVHAQADDFAASYITFANTFDKSAHPDVSGTQAVALAMEGDRQVYTHDIFYGHQDTLLTWNAGATNQLRQYVYESEIDGDVDFIAGDGTLVVDRSFINALGDGTYSSAYLTAPATPAAQKYGILVNDSTVNTTLANGKLYLGRAWKPAPDSDPQVAFRNTLIPQAVNSAPWLGVSGATWSPGRYGEYGSTGPGASSTSTADRPLINGSSDTTPAAYLAGTDGWNPVAPPTAPAPSIGDRRPLVTPTLPPVCQTLSARLPGGTRTFSAGAEQDPPDTARIQAALDACAGTGGGVYLTPSGKATAFLAAPLTVHAGEYLVVSYATTLYASRVPSQYQMPGKATCGTADPNSGTGCYPFISVLGRDAGVMGTDHGGDYGVIDGRGDTTMLRTDGTDTGTTWYELAEQAKEAGTSQVNPRLIQSTQADDVTFYHITLANSAKQHLFISRSIGATVYAIRIQTPATPLNTDGVDFDSSTEATLADSWIMAGDDCVALTTNNAAESAITVAHNHCYGTHGLSIGSGTTYGLDALYIHHNTVDGRDYWGTLSTFDNGIRAKSNPGKGGPVTNVVYAQTCMTDVQNLIVVTPNYAPPSGTTIPWFKSLTIDRARAVDSVPGASSDLEGYNADYPSGITLHQVYLDATAVTAAYAHITLDNTNLHPSGPGVTSTEDDHGAPQPLSCAFPTFPLQR